MILGAPSCQQEFRFDQRKMPPASLVAEGIHDRSSLKTWRPSSEATFTQSRRGEIIRHFICTICSQLRRFPNFSLPITSSIKPPCRLTGQLSPALATNRNKSEDRHHVRLQENALKQTKYQTVVLLREFTHKTVKSRTKQRL